MLTPSRILRVSPSASTIFLLAAFVHGLASTPVAAQTASRRANSSWELNLHAAAMRPGLFDESDEGFQIGGRLLRNFGSGISLGGSVDWASTKDVTVRPFAGLNASLLLYSAGLEYRFRVSPRAAFLLGAGVGAATLTFDEVPSGVAESSTGLLFPFGGGFKIYGRPEAPSWAFRVDFRDNVIMLDTTTPEGEVATEPRHNLELSAGFSLLLGSERPPSRPIVDSDRDGVPDSRDRCYNRPGVEVDADGCPIPPPAARPVEGPAPGVMGPQVEPERVEPEPSEAAEPRPTERMEPAEDPVVPERAEAAVPGDEDGDGVPDDRDACPGTPAGIHVDARGCLARPPEETEPIRDAKRAAEPEPRPAGPGAVAGPTPTDRDGDGVPDNRDACPGTPVGIAVDERGCLARPPEETPEPSVDEPRVDFPEPRVERGPPAPSADDAPPLDRPAVDPTGAADACLETQEWFVEEEAIEYDGRSFETVGSPKPVDRQFLVRVGAYQNVPIYVSDTSDPPYTDFWMPVCGPEDLFELYMDASSLPWNR